ncbi:cell division control protein 6 homolog B [Neltuma alba]|uniref:cell division control protein 6 homolog B n=1 Tax=Neltuma alba TaxID=207710 RepID=UPI0010A514B6|nr:cell division control protein 6 homolog B-like [Prosopis alba]
MAVVAENTASAARSDANSTPRKRKLRSDAPLIMDSPISPPTKWKSPRRCSSESLNRAVTANEMVTNEGKIKSHKSLSESMQDGFADKPKWNPKDGEQVRTVKEALHVSTAPSKIVCREDEQNTVFEFCKSCIEHKKAGSMYICGCPGTGKSLSMEKVKELLVDWARQAGFLQPDVLSVNCTSLANTSDIFIKILGLNQPRGKKTSASPLQQLQNLYSQKSSSQKMTLIVVDELDYLITKDRAVLHDLFMLTTFPFSRCILIGISNAIDLADRFLPRLKSLNCKPIIVTFRAYSKEQILGILKERLRELPYAVFQHQALELCARKVAAASGDMRKALCLCRSAIEMQEAEIRESIGLSEISLEEKAPPQQTITSDLDHVKKQEFDVVRIDHMALALSKTYRSPAVDTIQSLPHHQQIILCSSMKHFSGTKKDTILGELYKSYAGICKSSLIPPAGILEFSNMCRVLNDQGLIKLGPSREDKLKRVTLRIDEADITFALQGIRFFRNCLQ